MPTPFQLRLAERMPVEIVQGQNLCRNFSCNKHKNKRRAMCKIYWQSIYKKQSLRSSNQWQQVRRRLKASSLCLGKKLRLDISHKDYVAVPKEKEGNFLTIQGSNYSINSNLLEELSKT